MGRQSRHWVTTALDLIGALLVAYGAWLIFHPAGFIVAGALIIAASWAHSGSEGVAK